MDNIDLTPALMHKYNGNPKVNKVGRYSVSMLWGMMTVNSFTKELYTTPEAYLRPEPHDFEGVMNMWQGTHKHAQVQELLDGYDKEIKKVMIIKIGSVEFELVGQVDAINATEGLEIKTSQKLHTSSKKWHDYQARIYCSMFERDVFKVCQPVVTKDKILLNVLAEIKRNDTWFNKEMAKLASYHEKLVALEKERQAKPVYPVHSQ